MTSSLTDWPLPPQLDDPEPSQSRRSWGKLSHEERFKRQRRDLLRASARLASRQGYEGTRVADIVAEAGLSKSTFYEHFDSKEACFIELQRRTSTNMLRAAITTAEANLDRGAQPCLVAVVGALVGYAERDPRLAAAMRTGLDASNPAIRKLREANFDNIVAFFVALAKRLGTPIDDDELSLTARVLVRGVTDVLGELRRAPAKLDDRIEAVARMGCRAFALTS